MNAWLDARYREGVWRSGRKEYVLSSKVIPQQVLEERKKCPR